MHGGFSPSLALVRRFAALRAARADNPPSARLYNALFAAIVLPAVSLMVAVALIQEPLSGDLTRPGGYTEARHGWNAPQERFSPPLASETYDRPSDIVVLGDSFSMNIGAQTDSGAYWTNYVAQRTGLSVSVVPVSADKGVTFAWLERHPVFTRAPPKLLIVELVERYLLRDYAIELGERVGLTGLTCRPEAHDLAPLPARPPLDAATVPWIRDVGRTVDFDQAANFLWKAAARNVLGIDRTRIFRFDLTRPGLFSSRDNARLLIYDDEIRKTQFATPQALDTVSCTLLALQNRVHAGGRTRFLFMAVPDKLSAYADYLADSELRALTILPRIYADPALNQVKLLDRFRDAVRRGVPDVYLPNDTHWGSAGHRMAGEAVAEAIAQMRGPRPDQTW